MLCGFWLGLVVNDLGFVVGWLWRFVGFGLDHWFWVYYGVVGGEWSHSYGFMGFDDADEVVLLVGLWLLLMVDGFGFIGFAYVDGFVSFANGRWPVVGGFHSSFIFPVLFIEIGCRLCSIFFSSNLFRISEKGKRERL